jgi:hypothetical protein
MESLLRSDTLGLDGGHQHAEGTQSLDRPMSSIESYLSELNVGSIAVLYRRTGAVQRELRHADLVRACERLAARHPSLRRAIATSVTGAHRFLVDASKTLDVTAHARLERLDPDDDVRPVPTNGKWLHRFQAELHRLESFALGRPPWNVLMLVGDHAIVSFFYFNHAIGDGMSGVIAQHDLLALLEDSSTAAELRPGLPVTAELKAAFGSSWLRWALRPTGTARVSFNMRQPGHATYHVHLQLA